MSKEDISLDDPRPLLFQTLSSKVDFSFWDTLTKNKLEIYKLSEEPVEINGLIGSQNGASCLHVSSASFEESASGSVAGRLYNCNTIESFIHFDRATLWKKSLAELSQLMQCAHLAPGATWSLCPFFLISFSDLKKYKYYHWFCFPQRVFSNNRVAKMPTGPAVLSSVCRHGFQLEVATASKELFYVARMDEEGHLRISPETTRDFWKDGEERFIVFRDPGSSVGNPGWPLRNILFYLSARWEVDVVSVVCWRSTASASFVLRHVEIPSASLNEPAKAIGWEKDKKGKLKPRMVNLASQMDPARLAATAVDLNLKLMRWRLAPSLDLGEISSLKCLLLGAGTLGCNVARALLGWGVRTITFVDNGKVSFSNPVRQTLYKFEDCLNGGKSKAECAAASVREVFPGCNATGYHLDILMPGHHISEKTMPAAKKNHDDLFELVKSHDVIFLLTDSREARWLGSVMGAQQGKIVINCALGFDTYLVMRHGNRLSSDDESSATSDLGCYFCNDVVAPTDSLRDRSLDQQCTVTRPGVSYLASGIAAELLVSILQHPLKNRAPADAPTSMGSVPHQIRGFVGKFTSMSITGHPYDRCTACSDAVLKAYTKDPFAFVLRVCNEPQYLEDITGLTEMKAEEVDWATDLSVSDGGGDDFEMD